MTRDDEQTWHDMLATLAAQQAARASEGRDALRQGLPVIFIHGRPYRLPLDDDDDDNH